MANHLLKAVGLLCVIAVVSYAAIWGISEFKLRQVETPQGFNKVLPITPTSLEYGKHLARTRGCFGCHGQKLEGRVFTEQWPWVKRAVAPNLVAYAKQHSPSVLEAAIRHGIGHDGRALWSMPSYNWANLNDTDLSALIGYLQSETVVKKALPSPELGLNARYNLARGQATHMAALAKNELPLNYASSKDIKMRQGEYIAKTTCNECHGADLRGNVLVDFETPSLVMVAAYSDEEFRRLMSTGVSRTGRENLGLMTVVSKDRFAYFTDEELTHLLYFLRTLSQHQ